MKKLLKRSTIVFILCLAMLTGNLLTVSAAAKGTGKNVWSNYSNLKKAIQKSDLVDEGNRYIYYMSGKDFYCITYFRKE